MIPGRTRAEQKAGAIQKVKEMYGVTLGDDIAEAILMGKYAADVLMRQELRKKLFQPRLSDSLLSRNEMTKSFPIMRKGLLEFTSSPLFIVVYID